MESIKKILSSVPLWGWIAIAIAILFLVNYVSARVLNRSLFNLALDQLRKDQSQIVQQKTEEAEAFKKQVLDLQNEVKKIQQEKAIEKAKAIASAAEVTRLKGRINDLQDQIDKILISNDPDVILDDLRRLGIRSIKRRDSR